MTDHGHEHAAGAHIPDDSLATIQESLMAARAQIKQVRRGVTRELNRTFEILSNASNALNDGVNDIRSHEYGAAECMSRGQRSMRQALHDSQRLVERAARIASCEMERASARMHEVLDGGPFTETCPAEDIEPPCDCDDDSPLKASAPAPASRTGEVVTEREQRTVRTETDTIEVDEKRSS